MIGKIKCLRCKNYIGGLLRDYSAKCKAFPNGIPEDKLMFISTDPCIDCNKGFGFKPENENDERENRQ